MKHSNELKNEVLARTDLCALIGPHVQKLKKQGPHYLALCCFHNEKSPSFVISPAKGIYKCFGCGKSGDALAFCMDFHGDTFPQAIERLASFTNTPVDLQKDTSAPASGNTENFSLVERAILARTLGHYDANSLYVFLSQKFAPAQVYAAFMRLYTGTAKDGSAIFWQVDQFKRIRTAQKITYKPDGHRDKKIPPQRLFTEAQGYKACLFGEHQVFEANDEDLLCIVESEKTALICSIAIPEVQGRRAWWLACHGTEGLTDAKMFALKGRRVVLVPDFSYVARATWGVLPMRKKPNERGQMQPAEDGIYDETYVSKAMKLQQLGCKVSFLNDWPQVKDGSDIADLILQEGNTTIGQYVHFEELPKYQEPNYSELHLTNGTIANSGEQGPVDMLPPTEQRTLKFGHFPAFEIMGCRAEDKKRVERLFSEYPNILLLCKALKFKDCTIERYE